MNKMITLVCCLCSIGLFAQYPYEPSSEHPYGLPNPEAPKELLDFAPMIGECDCISETRNPDQTWAAPEKMKWRFKYIMSGMGAQAETLTPDGRHSGSIRQFIAVSTRWYVHYYSSGSPSTTLPAWEGTKRADGKIVLYRDQTAPNGMEGYFRLSFYDIADTGFKWVGEWVDKTESVVFPTWKIDCSNGKIPTNTAAEKEAIQAASNAFSKAYLSKDVEAMMAMYTADAKIFPNNRDILSGEELKLYWTPRENGSSVTHHKIISEYIKFFGNYAHDYGYFEGKTKTSDGSTNSWKGKYVVVWRKEDGQWKMFLDIWNRNPPQSKP